MTRPFHFGPLALATGFAVLTSTTAIEAREVKGELIYLERVALPDQAEVLIEVRQGEDVVTELRAATGGAQVPIPFVLGVDGGSDQVLTGALLVDGQVTWITEPTALPDSGAAIDLGPLRMSRYVSQGGFTSDLDCGGQRGVIGFSGPEGAVLTFNGTTYTLTQTIAASGARYSDGQTPETVFWNKGDMAYVTIAGVDLPECRLLDDLSDTTDMDDMSDDATLALPFIARGNEPGWVLNITGDGSVLSREDGSRVDVAGPLPQPETVETGTRYALSDDLAVTITPGICRDSMTGLPYPATVSLVQGGEAFAGCGGDPSQLLAGDWTVTRIGEDEVPEGIAVTLAFDEGRISGASGCNRFMGSAELTGESLRFGQMAGTMMACSDQAMAVERSFHEVMGQIDHFDISDEGDLVLTAGDVPLVRASRSQ